mmetsp:Transcript_16554/g.35787  ORF Transcript_16554/g.35787 Transcript_16554/m.35787 type:complete len:750 (+) Transcript_16554:154-2403(+)
MPHAIQRPEISAPSLQKNMAGRGKQNGGRAGRGRGRGGGRGGDAGRGAGGGRGRGPGRGGAGRGGRGAVQQRQAPPQVRLFYLKQHLILKCFNYLDDQSRLNVFNVMDWPAAHYEKRKAVMRQQRANMKLMKEKRMKEEEDRKKKVEEEERKKNEEEEEKKTEDSLENCGEGEENDGGEDNGDGSTEPENKEEEQQTPTQSKDADADLKDLKNLTLNEADGEAKSDKEDRAKDGKTPADNEAKGDTKGSDGKQANGGGDLYGGEEATEKSEASPAPVEEEEEVLPPLFARIDPHTLLDRLNTRRLYLRILHFKREQRKKIEAILENEDGDGEADEKKVPLSGIQGMFDDKLEEHRLTLKDKATADRVYRKNMTIQEMADIEWDELMEQAEIRNNEKEVPFYPTPTQHELLLFSPCPRAVGVLASYPRSGNSLMRTMYEHTTLRVTGSDMQGGLAKHDLVGEMAIGTNLVQFVKTHFPERQGGAPFRASRVVLLVRNPFDAIDSFFNLMMTGTHTATVSPEVRAKTAKIFESVVLKEIRVWKMFHEFWLNQDVPIMLIRYEDLIRKPDKVMSRVVQFVLEVKRMGTFFTDRIDRCIKEQAEIEAMGSYKPRSGGIGKSMSKYSPELLKTLKADKDLRRIMGYLDYQDLLVKPPERWNELAPLQDYATEYLPSWEKTGNKKVVMVNRGNLARGKNEVTYWQRIKMELGMVDGNCDCEKCRAKKKQGASSNDQGEGGEGAGSEVEQKVNAGA